MKPPIKIYSFAEPNAVIEIPPNRFGDPLGFGDEFGFTPDRFEGNLYIETERKVVYIQSIKSKLPRHGNFSRLIGRILKAGYSVKVCEAYGVIRDILKKKQFEKTVEYILLNTETETEVWKMDPLPPPHLRVFHPRHIPRPAIWIRQGHSRGR